MQRLARRCAATVAGVGRCVAATTARYNSNTNTNSGRVPPWWTTRTATRWVLGALFVIFLSLGKHLFENDPYYCQSLVRDGHWPVYDPPSSSVDPASEWPAWADYEQLQQLEQAGREPPPQRGFEQWEPSRCRMREYSRDDVAGCLRGRRLVFAGDTAMRQLFFAAVTRLDHEVAEWLLRTIFVEGTQRKDLHTEAEGVQLDFLWDPWLNGSVLGELDDQERDEKGKEDDNPIAMVLLGAPGLWAARNGGDAYWDLFREAVERVVPSLSSVRAEEHDKMVFLAPVQEPRYDLLTSQRAKALAPERIHRMNEHLHTRLSTSSLLDVYNAMSRSAPDEAYDDTGLHITDAVAERWIDIPLNVRCNSWLAENHRQRHQNDYDGDEEEGRLPTCCVQPLAATASQTVVLAGSSLIVVLGVVSYCSKRGNQHSSSGGILRHAVFLAASLLYSFVTDRQSLFSHTEKHFSKSGTVVCLLVAACFCVASFSRDNVLESVHLDETVKSSPLDNNPLDDNNNNDNIDLLPRCITDEIKGLLLLVILLLDYQQDLADPSSAAVQLRPLATGFYLCLSAYGHTTYFLRTRDLSLRRVGAVFFRLHFLSSLLRLVLGTTSETDTIPRLVSFWFLVVFATWRFGLGLGLGLGLTQSTAIRPRFAPIVVAAVLVFGVVLYPQPYGLLELTDMAIQRSPPRLRPFLSFFFFDFDVDTARRVVRRDFAAPFLGMVLAVLVRRVGRRTALQRRRPFNGSATATVSTPSPVSRPDTIRQLRATVIVVALLSSLLLAGHVAVSRDENRCPVTLCYVVFLSLLASRVAVNNDYATTPLTPSPRYMALPAALGRYALEIRLLYDHVVLAGNGTALLHTGLWTSPTESRPPGLVGVFGSLVSAIGWTVETALLVVVCLFFGYKVHLATRALTDKLFG